MVSEIVAAAKLERSPRNYLSRPDLGLFAQGIHGKKSCFEGEEEVIKGSLI